MGWLLVGDSHKVGRFRGGGIDEGLQMSRTNFD